MLGIMFLVFTSLLLGVFSKKLDRRTLFLLIGLAVFMVFGYYQIRQFL
jgi:predicted MFS family arabinose efflux permease